MLRSVSVRRDSSHAGALERARSVPIRASAAAAAARGTSAARYRREPSTRCASISTGRGEAPGSSSAARLRLGKTLGG